MQGMFELTRPRGPVPIIDDERYPVLDHPLDVPIGDLGIAFTIVAKHWMPLRKIVEHAPPRMSMPAGEIVHAHLVLPSDWPRLWNITGWLDPHRRIPSQRRPGRGFRRIVRRDIELGVVIPRPPR